MRPIFKAPKWRVGTWGRAANGVAIRHHPGAFHDLRPIVEPPPTAGHMKALILPGPLNRTSLMGRRDGLHGVAKCRHRRVFSRSGFLCRIREARFSKVRFSHGIRAVSPKLG